MVAPLLLIDGSVNTQSKVGYGAYLLVPDLRLSLKLVRTQVKIRRFEKTSSTKLELQTLLWALSDIDLENNFTVYTDSQNIIGLMGRRKRFEQNDYCSKKNRRLNNYTLYQEFYRLTDQLNCDFVKVCGHKISNQKDRIDSLFTLVDRASRSAMRDDTK